MIVKILHILSVYIHILMLVNFFFFTFLLIYQNFSWVKSFDDYLGFLGFSFKFSSIGFNVRITLRHFLTLLFCDIVMHIIL